VKIGKKWQLLVALPGMAGIIQIFDLNKALVLGLLYPDWGCLLFYQKTRFQKYETHIISVFLCILFTQVLSLIYPSIYMRSTTCIAFFILFSFYSNHTLQGQNLEQQQAQIEQKLQALEAQRMQLLDGLEGIKLSMIQRDLVAVGLPSEPYIMHSAMALQYSEQHEQAVWVAHMILPDIIEGSVARTNDFREDPMVPTGTAVEADYFLKTMKPDSTFAYDGFGYDRGHLAPSADFRWSEKALSESYFYSNMSPQLADFNRGAWAELEGTIRGYIFNHPNSSLYVVTGPVLTDALKPIERSINKVSVPEKFFKVVLDLDAQLAIGFIMPNEKIEFPLEHFAVSVDDVEALTGLDFFNKLDDALESSIESQLDKSEWIPSLAEGSVEVLYQPDLPPNHFNTIVAKNYMGKKDEITVCGRVVGSRYSRTGNLWLNLDKQFPNQIFSVFIRKADLVNFSYNPKEVLEGKEVWFRGVVENFNGTPTMNVDSESNVDVRD
jgi:endonuclease G